MSTIGSIIVRVRDFKNQDKEAEDIYLCEDKDGVVLEDRQIDGATVPHTHLDQLLPAAINQNPPMKGIHSNQHTYYQAIDYILHIAKLIERLYQSAKTASGSSHVALGSIQSILRGDSTQLRMDKVRVMPLTATQDSDTFLCDVYLETKEKSDTSTAAENTVRQWLALIRIALI